MSAIHGVLSSFFGDFTLRDVIDILLIAVIIYQILNLTRQTRAIEVLKGLGILIVVAFVSEALRLQTMNWLLNYIINFAVIVMVVLFQPEIRRLLQSIGQGRFLRNVKRLFSSREETVDYSHVGEALFNAMMDMSRTRTGALIIIEQDNPLDNIMETGTRIDAEVTSSLIENLFYPNTPLHDGAVIIRDGRVASAACILPLTQRTDIDPSLGTRHRACIGLSEACDAYCFVVSEERGVISMARDGVLKEDYDSVMLRTELNELFGAKPVNISLWKALTSARRNGGKKE